MKAKLSKSLILPMLYGILAAWLIAGGIGVALLMKFPNLSALTIIVATSALLLMAIVPSIIRATWVYSNLRRYHTAEYFYNLGNGLERAKAVTRFEKRVNKAVYAWINRFLLRPAFNVVIVGYLLLVLDSGSWVRSLWIFPAMILVVIAIEIGVRTMLFAARKLSYDKYGNLKNN